ncbi:PP2C family protein-serine/threonine phosphatase [Glutamicibacter creatinolyticus]|uniref:PP2C family protein-serine/threonine phosphatase n=1 Tax=Glutamicibacter creatinolyticus TaxID=162496 RepID=UPI0037BF33E1
MSQAKSVAGFGLVAAGRTHVGMRRTENQDAILITPTVFAVADGMGGHEAGELASELATETLEELTFYTDRTPEHPLPTVLDVIRQVQLADDRIRDALDARGGTTLCALLQVRGSDTARDSVTAPISVPPWTASFNREQARTDVMERITPEMLAEHRRQDELNTAVDKPQPDLLLVNVGDSRGYRLRGGVLQQLTRDHSAVQEMVDAGQITELEARNHPHRNLITRALGAGADSHPDTMVLKAHAGDRYLLCSDGLSGELTAEHLQALLLSYQDPEAAVVALLQAALEAGGRDNIAVIVIDVLPAPDPAELAEAAADRAQPAPQATAPVPQAPASTESAARPEGQDAG